MNKGIQNQNGDQSVEPTEAVALVDGSVPISCEIGKRRPIDFDEIAEAEFNLLFARQLHANNYTREAFQYAVRAAIDLFSAVGGDRELQEPLRHLFSALFDLDNGSQDEALVAEKVANRRIKPSAEWEERACLAAALEAKIKRGEKEHGAAVAICTKYALSTGTGAANRFQEATRLVEWRKQFRSRNKKPPAGSVVWDTALGLISSAQSLPEEWQRHEKLIKFEDSCLELAEKFAGRTSRAQCRKPRGD